MFRFYAFLSILVYNSFREFFTINFPDFSQFVYLERILRSGVDLGLVLLATSFFLRGKLTFSKLIFIAFIFASTLTFVYTSDVVDLLTHLNGLREPLFFLASLVILEQYFLTKHKYKIAKQFTVFLIIFAVVQIPVAVCQFCQYGAGDLVGGTFFHGSGILTQLLFIISFYLLVVYGSTKDYSSFKIKSLLAISILLIPVFLNETKISFILLIVYFFLLINVRKYVLRSVAIMLIGGLMFLLLLVTYASVVPQFKSFSYMLDREYLHKYLVSTEERKSISRYGKIILAFEMVADKPGKLLLGNGYGITKGQNVLGTTEIGDSLSYLFKGSNTLLFMTFFQGGILLVVIILVANFYFLVRKPIYPQSENEKRFKRFVILVFVSMWFYNWAIFIATIAIVSSYMVIWLRYGSLRSGRFPSLSVKK